MKRWQGPILAGLAVAAATHVAIVVAAPWALMATARGRMAALGAPTNAMVALAPPGPESRTVVRPSPDLAYSVCMIDLSGGPVAVSAAQDHAGVVLALYGANTDAFWSAGALTAPGDPAPGGAVAVLVLPPGAAAAGPSEIVAPDRKVMALVRRLAPGPQALAAIASDRVGDRCGPP